MTTISEPRVRQHGRALVALAVVALLALFNAGCATKSADVSARSAAATDPNRSSTLIWATITAYPQEEIDKKAEYVRFLPYVAEHMRQYGITDVKLVIGDSPTTVATWLREGKVDFFDESPFSAYIVSRLSGADEPLLNRWKYGTEKFTGVIFTRKKGGVKSLDELKGKMIVLKDPTSTANYFLPKWYLISKGYTVSEKKSLEDQVAPGEIGYVFNMHSRDREVEMVMDGVVAGGGISDEFIEKLLARGSQSNAEARHPRAGAPQTRPEDLRILARTDTTLRRLLTVRKDLDPRVKAAVKDLLLNMHQSPEGQAVLKTYGPSTRFSNADTPEVAYVGIRDKGKLLEDEVARWAKR